MYKPEVGVGRSGNRGGAALIYERLFLHSTGSIVHLMSISGMLAFHVEFGPLGVDTFVQRHADGIHLGDGSVKVRFEITVCTERFSDMASATVLCVELDGFEVVHILCQLY